MDHIINFKNTDCFIGNSMQSSMSKATMLYTIPNFLEGIKYTFSVFKHCGYCVRDTNPNLLCHKLCSIPTSFPTIKTTSKSLAYTLPLLTSSF